MAKLHLFNPENDFALALGRRSYTPDKGAVAIRKAGQLLPMWWAEKGDCVIVDSEESVSRAAELARRYGLEATAIVGAGAQMTPEPWGWSYHTRRIFAAMGIDSALLPTDDQLDSLRNLSHRRTAIEVGRLIGLDGDRLAVEATTVDEALEAIDRRGGDCVVKLPWSSSGRGIVYTNASPRPTLEGYITGMIRRQGSVTIERRYDRKVDFAMLFESDGATTDYRGLSTFLTDNRGFYAGNLVAKQQEIASRIGVDLSFLINPLRETLRQTAPDYKGWIGVDMLVYTANGALEIAPCIEINFRRTMGMAALAAANKLHPVSPLLLTHNTLTSI